METWGIYISNAYDDMVRGSDTRELGKLLAVPNEHFQRDWINENTNLNVLRRSDSSLNEGDRNESGFDLISENGLKIQSKFRSSTIHLECTRRISQKNVGNASQSGHVAYSLGECDAFAFTVPQSEKNALFVDPTGAEVVVIPAKDLEDPNNPGFLLRSVPKVKVFNKYKGRSKEILEQLDRTRSSDVLHGNQ